jgi:hypothetical protein
MEKVRGGSTLESMVELLQSSTLRKVTFTSVVSQTTSSAVAAKVLRKVEITDLFSSAASSQRAEMP